MHRNIIGSAALVLLSSTALAQACDQRYPSTCVVKAPVIVHHEVHRAEYHVRKIDPNRWLRPTKIKVDPPTVLPGKTVTSADARKPLMLPKEQIISAVVVATGKPIKTVSYISPASGYYPVVKVSGPYKLPSLETASMPDVFKGIGGGALSAFIVAWFMMNRNNRKKINVRPEPRTPAPARRSASSIKSRKASRIKWCWFVSTARISLWTYELNRWFTRRRRSPVQNVPHPRVQQPPVHQSQERNIHRGDGRSGYGDDPRAFPARHPYDSALGAAARCLRP